MEPPAWWTPLRAAAPRFGSPLTIASAIGGVLLATVYVLPAVGMHLVPSGEEWGVVGIIAFWTVGLLALAAAAAWLVAWRSWSDRIAGIVLVLYAVPFWLAGAVIWVFLTLE